MKNSFITIKIKKRNFVLINLSVLLVITLGIFLSTRDENKTYPMIRNSVEMPNLVGQTKENAIKVAESKGIKLNINKATSDQFEIGIILSQNPAIGDLVEFNSTVNVYVNEESNSNG
ncbi:PASTA domain-containing protein [Paenibacillus sp. MAH-36]|uniref:PASTA domain-containing protein n=1 Tax=Paenibacillus violae TaxID=3077234 RepID=A0ABU3RL18_9BACL|nr:PASTA domain-containing protein [Paenibacillus sp. PFR10]MDU0204899.1 PASTA domain-containing protein [Paenibacillus sp. PFR10]